MSLCNAICVYVSVKIYVLTRCNLPCIPLDEPVFGSNLCELCEKEQTKVPMFVTRVIRAVEARGKLPSFCVHDNTMRF